jgi:hypothetical protein
MNITIRHIMMHSYLKSIRKFDPREKLYLYPQYPFVSDLLSSLLTSMSQAYTRHLSEVDNH